MKTAWTGLRHRMWFATVAVVLASVSCSCFIVNLPPKGPFEFIGETKPFFFDAVGNTEEFTVEISDMANYELALIAKETPECIFPDAVMNMTPFSWRLEVSVWHKGKLLERQELGPAEEGEDFKDRMYCLEILQLGILEPLESLIGTKRFVVRVTVLAVDERYTDKNIPVQVGIRRSPRI